MRIFDTVLFDHEERRYFERAWRWTSFVTSEAVIVPFTEEEKKTLARMRDGNAMTKPVVLDAEAVWRHILAEMKLRVLYFEDLKRQSSAGVPAATGQGDTVPLVANPPQLAADFMENLEAGMPEVQKVIQILMHARLNMHGMPDPEWNDSEEAGDLAVDAIVVRR